MKFNRVGAPYDCVKTYKSEDGSVKLIKRPDEKYWIAKSHFCLHNQTGEEIGRYKTLEEAIAAFN